MIVQTLLLTALLSQIELEIPKNVSIGDRITISIKGDYERFVWNVKRINLDGEKLHLEDIEKGALKTNGGNTVDFTTKIPGSYRFFVSAANEKEIVQAIGQLDLDYDTEFVNRKKDIFYEAKFGDLESKPEFRDALDVGDTMPVDENSVEAQIHRWTKEVTNYDVSQYRVAELFEEEVVRLERGQVNTKDTLKNIYQRAKRELVDFDSWRPWFQHINDMCQDYGTQGETKERSDWIPILRGIGEEVGNVK